jgi:hypothetical protein
MNVNDFFVGKSEAYELKALGYDEPCLKAYENEDATKMLCLGDVINHNSNLSITYAAAPTFEQAFVWFMEWDFTIDVYKHDGDGLWYSMAYLNPDFVSTQETFLDYRSAATYALKHAIKIYKMHKAAQEKKDAEPTEEKIVTINVDSIERLQVINHYDSAIVKGSMVNLYKSMDDFERISISIQDNGKTLKIFLE